MFLRLMKPHVSYSFEKIHSISMYQIIITCLEGVSLQRNPRQILSIYGSTHLGNSKKKRKYIGTTGGLFKSVILLPKDK